MVMTTSGRCRRNAAARSRRSGTPYSTSPSGWSRNIDLGHADHGGAAPFLLHPQRADPSGAMPSMPASPSVAST